MNIKEQTQALWKQCFNDTDEFIQLYFSMRYSDSINQFIAQNGKVIAALQTIPYPMTWQQQHIQTAYISGACTHPDYRSKGIMGELLKQSHQKMHKQGVILSFLIPAEESLKAYYARFGYANSFFRTTESIVINRNNKAVDNYKTTLIFSEVTCKKEWNNTLFTFFQQEMNKRPCCIQHSQEDLTIVNADHFLSEGKIIQIYSTSSPHEIQGLAWVFISSSHLIIKELVLQNPSIKPTVIQQLGIHYQADKIEFVQPSGMIRIIHLPACLQLLFQADLLSEKIIQITGDTHIPENNGYYQLQNGQYIQAETLSYDTSPIPSFTIQEITSQLINQMNPRMSLMMD